MDAPQVAEADAAWAAVELTVAPDAVRRLLADPLLLLRLNPCLEFQTLERLADGRLRLAAFNESNGCRIATEVELLAARDDIALRYAHGIKRETRVAVEQSGNGSRLTIKEIYAPPAEPAAEPPPEVDRSLLPWLAALRRHLERDARYGAIPGYRRLAEGFWASMPPRQRRVAWLIIWTTAVEFAVFLAVLAIYAVAN